MAKPAEVSYKPLAEFLSAEEPLPPLVCSAVAFEIIISKCSLTLLFILPFASYEEQFGFMSLNVRKPQIASANEFEIMSIC